VWQWCKFALRLVVRVFGVLAVCGALAHTFYYDETQLVLMRVFRDLSRYKTQARLYGGSNALMIAVMTGTEEKLVIPETTDDGMKFTLEELNHFDGIGGVPIYLAIMGRVYDVSTGAAFYGPARSYHHYAGKDATRSYATGCVKPECLVGSMVGLTELQKREAYRWLELYEYHDKYKFLGTVRHGNMEELVDMAILEEEALAAALEAESDLLGEDGKAASFEVRLHC
jgi:predicted heme/steroid binding protein